MRKLNVLLLIGQLLLIFAFWNKLPPELPLFYSRPWGTEQLAPPIALFILPGLTLIVFGINLILLSFVPSEEKLLTKILEIITIVFNLLCLIALTEIIFLVT